MAGSTGASTRRAWSIHAVVLVALTALYLFVSWDGWSPPPERSTNLEGFGAAILLIVLTVYAFVTTLLVAMLRRRPLAVLMLHALAIVGYVVAIRVGES